MHALLAVVLLAAPAPATRLDERRAVIAAVQDFFDALAAKDEKALMAAVVLEGRITSQRARDGRTQLRTQPWTDWAKSVAQAKETLEERMHNPKVRVSGSIASVWTYYTFRRNGAFSHCGIDNFDLAKLDGRWKIVNISYTVETEGCRRR